MSGLHLPQGWFCVRKGGLQGEGQEATGFGVVPCTSPPGLSIYLLNEMMRVCVREYVHLCGLREKKDHVGLTVEIVEECSLKGV